MLLQASSSQLLIVDVQERLLPAMAEPEKVVRGCRILLEAALELSVPAMISEQYPKGLGRTVAPILEKAQSAEVLPKTAFACTVDPAIAEELARRVAQGRTQVVVAGLEAHVCVLQTCLGLAAAGLQPLCVVDAVSARDAASVEATKSRLQHAGIAQGTVEMVLFEWLGAAGTPAFRKLSALIR